MTEAAIRSLIDSYIVDNQAYNITPAQIRDMMQQTIDFIITEAGGGSTATPDLPTVLGVGNISTLPIIIGSAANGTQMAPAGINVTVASAVLAAIQSTATGGTQGDILLRGPGATAFHHLQAPNGATADQIWKLPMNVGGGTLEYQGRVTIDVAAVAGNTTTHSIIFGTALNNTTISPNGVSGEYSGLINFQLGFDAANSGQLMLRNTSGTGNITLKSASSATAQTLTMPAKTDTLATIGDTGIFYRLTITATGASSYTWGIPTLPFTPIMWFVQIGAPYGATSDIYGSGTTNTVTVNYVGAAPAAGTPLFFFFQIHG